MIAFLARIVPLAAAAFVVVLLIYYATGTVEWFAVQIAGG